MIRNGMEKDAKQIAELKIKNYKKTYASIFSKKFLDEMSEKKEEEKYLKEFKNRKVLVYYEENKILGYIYYGRRKNHKEILSDYDGEIYALYVDIDSMNKGIGTKLIKTALNDLINDYKKVILWCMNDNLRSIKFYKRRNFKQSDQIMSVVGSKTLYESAFVFDFKVSDNYRITRFVSYKEKNNIIALYSNLNLLFFKNETVKWLKEILYEKSTKEIPISFYKYLIKKEVIEIA